MIRSAASGAIGLAALSQLPRNFWSWAVRVIGRAGCPYITSMHSVSRLPSRSVISTVTGTRAFGSGFPSTTTSTRRASSTTSESRSAAGRKSSSPTLPYSSATAAT